jgi:hypothetical protein
VTVEADLTESPFGAGPHGVAGDLWQGSIAVV